MGVEILNRMGARLGYLTEPNSEYRDNYLGSQSAWDKLRGQKGNNPDRRLRSLNHTQSLRRLNCGDSQDVGLEAATI